MSDPAFRSRLREHRRARTWTQAELARRSGLSRASVSAIETGRVVPSTVAALALARALDVGVEELFALGPERGPAPWAWAPPDADGRWWRARLPDGDRRFPVEPPAADLWPHDGRRDPFPDGSWSADPSEADRTLVVAGCDPAAGLLARCLHRRADLRLLFFPRSSRRALELLDGGRVHAAGVHLGGPDDGRNQGLVAESLGTGHRLLRVAVWTEGLAVAPGVGVDGARALLTAGLRWVGREEGSGARACLERLAAESGLSPPEARGTVRGHREVSTAIRSGWADAGVCVHLAAAEADLDFLTVGREAYDLVLPPGWDDDPRYRSLVDTVRSGAYRRWLGDLPGYDSGATGSLL